MKVGTQKLTNNGKFCDPFTFKIFTFKTVSQIDSTNTKQKREENGEGE